MSRKKTASIVGTGDSAGGSLPAADVGRYVTTTSVTTETVADISPNGPEHAYRNFALDIGGTVVHARLFDGGDVEIRVNGHLVAFDEEIILRWGRKR